MKKFGLIAVVLGMVLFLTGCSDADVVSERISTEADYFKIERRIVFYNGITGDYMLSIEGRCSLGNDRTAEEVSITCKTGEDTYKKHFLGLSDNVTYFIEQVTAGYEDPYHYLVVFKPATILPDIDLKVGGGLPEVNIKN
jgi:hypothetical protein